MLFDDNTVGIAAIGDAAKVCVWRVKGEGHVRAELLETGLASGQLPSESTKQPTGSKVAGLELGDCGAHLGDTANDLMSRNAWIDSGHCAPLVTDGGGGQSGRYRRKGFRSEHRLHPDRAGGLWWGQAAISHSQQNRPSLYTGHVIQG